MPPVVANLNDVYKVRMQGRIEGQVTFNVFYFKSVSGAGDTDVLDHLIMALFSCFIDHLVPVMPISYRYEKMIWQKVFPDVGPEFETLPPDSAVGETAGDALPSFCSSLVSVRTSRAGKSGRGRIYLAGIPESASNQSFFDPSGPYWVALVAFAACLATKFIIGDPPGDNAWQMMVYSRKLGGNTLPIGNAGLAPVTNFVPRQQLATTNSRKVGRGA